MDLLPGRPWLYQPLPSAKLFHELKSRFKGFSGPVGSGKSYAFAYEALFNAYLNPGRWGFIGAPTYPMLRDATQRTLFEVLGVEEIPYRFIKSENRLVLEDNGAEIIFRSLDDFERLRGTNLAWFGVDELTYAKGEAWLRLEARLRDKEALRLCGFAAWTPKGFDAVYKTWISNPKPGYEAILARPRENHYVDKTGMYDRLAASYDDKLYRQEVLGEYLSLTSGAVYYAFAREASVGKIHYNKALPLCWSLDFNVNPMCSVIAQIEETFQRSYTDILRGKTEEESRTKRIFVLDEIALANSNTPEACEEFVERARKLADGRQIPVRVYGDPAGAARSTAGKSDWLLVKEYLGRCPDLKATYHVDAAHPAVKDRVNAVNAAFRSSTGERRLFVDSKCRELIADLEQVIWKAGATGQIDKSDLQRTHASDALGYLVQKEMPLRGKSGFMGGPYIA